MTAVPPPAAQDQQGERSVGSLLGDISRDLSNLLRQELELAKAEARQSATRAGRGAGMLGGAGVAGNLALTFVSVALWWGLGNSLGRSWAALVVALIWAVVAGVLTAAGRGALKDTHGLPATTDTVKKIPDALKGKEHH